jgi:hypothetical protein
MTADDVLDVLRRLDAAGIDWWIDGGWGWTRCSAIVC